MDLDTCEAYDVQALDTFDALVRAHGLQEKTRFHDRDCEKQLGFVFGRHMVSLCHFAITMDTLPWLWNRACDHVGIPRDGGFIPLDSVFPDENPYLTVYNNVLRLTEKGKTNVRL